MKHLKRKQKELPSRTLNIWNRYDFATCGRGKRRKPSDIVSHIARCIVRSRQRIVRGYADSDVWCIYGYLQELIPAMLQELKDTRHGSPGFLGENYTNDEGYIVNDTCHAEWDKILDRMIFLWRESDDETCSKINPFEDEFSNAFDEFTEKFGILGEKLQTEEELERHRKHGSGGTVHFMNEVPEYKEIYEKYYEEDEKIEQYRNSCKDEAIDMLKEYFFCLWD